MAAIALSLLAAISLGGGAVWARSGMPGVHPVAVTGVALVVGFVGVAGAALAVAPSGLWDVPGAAWPWVLGLGMAQFTVGRSMAYTGVSLIGASRTALFISSQVPFAAFFAIVFAGESLRPLVGVGTVGVVSGLALASGDSLTEGWRADRRYVIGCVTGLTAGAATGVSTVIAKRAVMVYDSPLAITALSMLAAMVVVLPVVSVIAVRSRGVRSFEWRAMGFIGLSGISTTVSIVALLFAVQLADVVVVAPIMATFPLWTLLLSHIFISRLERITLRLTVGAVVAVAGVAAVAWGGQL